MRILRDYIADSDTWEGVARYRGKKADDPQSQQTAQEYVEKVQKIYGYVARILNPRTLRHQKFSRGLRG